MDMQNTQLVAEQQTSEIRILGRELTTQELAVVSGGVGQENAELMRAGTDDHAGTCTNEADCD